MLTSFPHVKPKETPVVAEVGQMVYVSDAYKRQGRIIVDFCADHPGQVKVKWLKPKEREAWIMLNRLRLKDCSKRLIFKNV